MVRRVSRSGELRRARLNGISADHVQLCLAVGVTLTPVKEKPRWHRMGFQRGKGVGKNDKRRDCSTSVFALSQASNAVIWAFGSNQNDAALPASLVLACELNETLEGQVSPSAKYREATPRPLIPRG